MKDSLFTQADNPRAMAAYRLAAYGLIPVVGLILGPVAVVLGAIGLRHARANPAAGGGPHAAFGIVLGSLETVTNLVGLGLIAMSFSSG